MKHTLHIVKSRYVSSILLILLLAFVSMGASSPVNTEQVSAGQNCNFQVCDGTTKSRFR